MAAVIACAGLPLVAVGPARAGTTTLFEQHYDLRATLDYGAAHLDVVEELTLTNRSSQVVDHVNLSVIPRAFGYLAMTEPVTVDAAPVEVTWTTGTNLRVPMPAPMRRGETRTIRLQFALNLGLSPPAFRARLSA